MPGPMRCVMLPVMLTGLCIDMADALVGLASAGLDGAGLEGASRTGAPSTSTGAESAAKPLVTPQKMSPIKFPIPLWWIAVFVLAFLVPGVLLVVLGRAFKWQWLVGLGAALMPVGEDDGSSRGGRRTGGRRRGRGRRQRRASDW